MEESIAIDLLKTQGWVVIPNVYPKKLMSEIKEEFYEKEEEFIKIQQKKGILDQVINATHHTSILCRKMLKLLELNKTSPILDMFFEGKYILNTMGLSKVEKDRELYTKNIHRDVRSFVGANNLWLNTLVMLDDSTEQNGATWLLASSRNKDQKPDDAYFYKNAVRATGKSGDVLIFDGDIWHAAGDNQTNHTRHIITPFYSKPFIKQQLDYPRAFGPDFGRTCSEHLRQLLGYNSLVPVTLDEFYQKDDERYYKSDQG